MPHFLTLYASLSDTLCLIFSLPASFSDSLSQASRPDSKLLAGRVTKHLLAAATECQLIGTRTSYLQHMTGMLCELKAPSDPPHHAPDPCDLTAQCPGTLATAAGFAHSVAKIHSIAANDAASVMNLLEFWAAG